MYYCMQDSSKLRSLIQRLVVQADIGVKNGKIIGIGKAGNPDIMDGVTEHMIVGSSTEVRHDGVVLQLAI
jgi:urease alpha subunit